MTMVRESWDETSVERASTPVVEATEVSMTYPGSPPVTVLYPTSLAVYPGDQVAVVREADLLGDQHRAVR